MVVLDTLHAGLPEAQQERCNEPYLEDCTLGRNTQRNFYKHQNPLLSDALSWEIVQIY